MALSSRGAVVAALCGNSLLTVIKTGAFMISGSGAMLSEAVHSFADTGNQALLYIGVRRSERAPDTKFHYGYGADRFLFALLSAVGIFVLGCGFAVYHGIHNLLHPPELSVGWITFAVLGLGFVIDGVVFVAALRAVSEQKGDESFRSFLTSSTDPTILAVLFEDFVALAGIAVAACGIWLSHVTGNPVYDAVSSIIIGVMLGMVAVWLLLKNRRLILGPSIPDDLQKKVIGFIEQQPSVQRVHRVKTRIIGADRYGLAAEIDYDGRFLAREHQQWARDQIDAAAGDPDKLDVFVLEFGERMLDGLGREVDRLEARIAERHPRMRHLDLESDWAPDD